MRHRSLWAVILSPGTVALSAAAPPSAAAPASPATTAGVGTWLTGVFIVDTSTTHIPATNATWAVAAAVADTGTGIVPGAHH